nr:hypothetical protein Itr_chr13CG14950 [Ipomoea trifida]
MPALNHSNMYSKTTLLRLGAQKRGKRREDGIGVSKSQELETLICLVHVSLLQREYVYLADQENASSIDLSNNHSQKHGNGSQFQNSYVYGVFENSINSPLSIITHTGTTSVQRLQVRAPLNDVTNGNTTSSNLIYSEFANIKQWQYRTTHQQIQCPIPNISDDLGRNLQAEADTNLPIRRSQRLTFQKGKAVVNSQQLIIDNIQNDKVVSMSALTGK